MSIHLVFGFGMIHFIYMDYDVWLWTLSICVDMLLIIILSTTLYLLVSHSIRWYSVLDLVLIIVSITFIFFSYYHKNSWCIGGSFRSALQFSNAILIYLFISGSGDAAIPSQVTLARPYVCREGNGAYINGTTSVKEAEG